MTNPRIAIVGAGPAGLMAAELLSQYEYDIHVFALYTTKIDNSLK